MATTLLFWNCKNNIAILKITDDMEAVRYYTKALKDLSARLSDPFDRTSAGVIATVIGCLCHDVGVFILPAFSCTHHLRQVHIGDWARWSTHIDGLYQIVKLRGGMDGLDNHIPAIASW